MPEEIRATEERIRRGKEAERILREPLVIEAFDLLARGVMAELSRPDITDQELRLLHLRSRVAVDFRNLFVGVIGSGQLASDRLSKLGPNDADG